jgi:hypothetical protein
MEMAILQQLISQEKRAGTGGGLSGVSSTFITEGNYDNGSYTDYPVLAAPMLYATGYRSCWPSSGGSSHTSENIRTYAASQSYVEPIISWLYMGGHWGGGGNSTSNWNGTGSGLQCHFWSEEGEAITKPFNVPNNSSSYGPIMAGVMFIRNIATSTQTLSFNASQAAYWSSGYDGSGVSAFVFNTDTLSTVTDCSWSNLWSYQGSTAETASSCSVNVPAGHTVALLFSQTMNYWTSFSSGGHWFYHLGVDWGSTFDNSNPDWAADLRTTAAFYSLRDMNRLDLGDHHYSNNGKNILVKSANMAADYFGDYS